MGRKHMLDIFEDMNFHNQNKSTIILITPILLVPLQTNVTPLLRRVSSPKIQCSRYINGLIHFTCVNQVASRQIRQKVDTTVFFLSHYPKRDKPTSDLQFCIQTCLDEGQKRKFNKKQGQYGHYMFINKGKLCTIQSNSGLLSLHSTFINKVSLDVPTLKHPLVSPKKNTSAECLETRRER